MRIFLGPRWDKHSACHSLDRPAACPTRAFKEPSHKIRYRTSEQQYLVKVLILPLGAVFPQEIRYLSMSLILSHAQRRDAALQNSVHIGASLEQQ